MSSHILDRPESYKGKAFTNDEGRSQCVEFIKQTLRAPRTIEWKEGKKLFKGDTDLIPPGTAIATFIDGKYPQNDVYSKHAAIFVKYDVSGLIVFDQWSPSKTEKVRAVAQRTIKFAPTTPGLSNDGNAFSVIEW